MPQEEVIDILTEELMDFLEMYLIITSLTHECMRVKVVPYKSINFFGNDNCRRHAIFKDGRTKLRFCLNFHNDEIDFLLILNKILNGYIDYNVYTSLNSKSYSFTFDVGSKQNFINLFNRISSYDS